MRHQARLIQAAGNFERYAGAAKEGDLVQFMNWPNTSKSIARVTGEHTLHVAERTDIAPDVEDIYDKETGKNKIGFTVNGKFYHANEKANKTEEDVFKATMADIKQRRLVTSDPKGIEALNEEARQAIKTYREAGAKVEAAAPSERVHVQKGGKDFTIPRRQLQQAISEGYNEVK
jgi:hypothetical protein